MTTAQKKIIKPQQNPVVSSMGLESLGDLAVLLDEPQAVTQKLAVPQEILLELIEEDPHQPRTADNPGFSPESIAEIGETIKVRGVKSPISVRENVNSPGKYIINHGARRYRGSKWAKKITIPVFIDNDYNQADQIIENLQRNELTAREIANFIGRELAKGKKKGEIAKEIGKSAAFITQHVTLLDLPDPIADVFNNNRAKDVTVVNELVTAYKQYPKEVNAWIADESLELTRSSVKTLRELLDKKFNSGKDTTEIENVDAVVSFIETNNGKNSDVNKEKSETKKSNHDTLKKTVVQVMHDNRLAHILLNRRPSEKGMGWIKYEDGNEIEISFKKIKIIALLNG